VNLTSLIVIGIAVILLMALSVIAFVVLYQRRVIRHQLEVKTLNEQKQLALLEASLQSEEEERRRIASELHDDVGASLSSIRLFLHKTDEQSNSPLIQQSKELIDETIKKVRDISHKLQPATLQMLGLYSSLHALAEIYNRSNGIKVEVKAEQSLSRLTPNTELHIYRIIQELINNIIKHSGAEKINISAFQSGEKLQFSLMHDGTGIAKENYADLLTKKGAIGLKNIENRLKFIHGAIEFEKMASNEYNTTVLVPLNEK
jgi:two-component system NarL family sensor kinase